MVISFLKLKNYWNNLSIQKQFWALTIPMVLSNLSVPLVSSVDTIVVGHLNNETSMASVGIGNGIYLFLIAVLNFLRMGTTGFTAQAFGNHDTTKIRQILLQGLILALLLAVALMTLSIPIASFSFWVMQPDAHLYESASQFFYHRIWGTPAALMNFALMGWFLGMQNARIPFYMMIATNICNIILTLTFIFVFYLDVNSIAQAAVLSEWFGLGVGLIFLPKILHKHYGIWDLSPLKTWVNWKPLIFVNRDIFIRSLTLHMVFFLITLQATRIGANTIAANMIILNGLFIMSYLFDGFAHGVEALAGKAIGEKSEDNLASVMTIAGGWSLMMSIVFCIAFLFFGKDFINLMSSIESVRENAYPLIPYLALLPLVAVWSYLLDGLFIGATKAREMRNVMLLAFIIALPLAILLMPLKNDGLWIAFLTFMFLRGFIMIIMSLKIQKNKGWF